MADTTQDYGALVSWFMGLRDERDWSQDRAAKILDVDQKTISNWKAEREASAAKGRKPRFKVIDPTPAKLDSFKARFDAYGIEVAELPFSLFGEVNSLLNALKESPVLAERLSAAEHERVVRETMAVHRGPIQHYINLRIEEWLEGVAATETHAHDRAGKGSASGC